jgi:hypothetical protein
MTDKPTAGPPAEDERPLWKLSRGEQRVLLVTFVGGLASIIVGAAVIGVALALAHRAEGPGHSLADLAGYSVVTVVLFAFWVAYVRWGTLGMPWRPLDRWPVSSRFTVLVGAVLVAGVALTWIGIAAGIH